jgi:hypothetical protein
MEAAVSLIWARAAVRSFDFRRAATISHEAGSDLQGEEETTQVREIRTALFRVSRRLPWESSCLVRALAGRRMLRRRGIPCKIHFGVNRDGEALRAHAWLQAGAEIVCGEEEAASYTPLTCMEDSAAGV